jgi:predicted TIM-barrel fold metal-dependent hydrolase
MAAVAEPQTERRTRRIDGDTHFFHTLNLDLLKEMLPRGQYLEGRDILRKTTTLRRPPSRSGAPERPDPARDADARLEEMDRLGFDTQVLMTQDAMPAPLNPVVAKPLWLRIPLAQLYNNAAAELQNKYAGRYIPMATVPWDDVPAAVKELERIKSLGLKAVQIKGSYFNTEKQEPQNLDTPALYPFWEAINSLGLACLVHNTTQGCGPTIADHDTTYPMVGTERYHRLHLGTYLGFGLDYAVACASLSLGGVLDEFPNLRFVFYEAGAGWMAYAMLGADRSYYIERKCSRTEIPPSELIKRHCFTAVESLEPLEQLVEAYGSDNFIIGSDFPHPEFQFLPNAPSDVTDKPRLTDEDKEKILGGNLARVLKLD